MEDGQGSVEEEDVCEGSREYIRAMLAVFDMSVNLPD